MRIVINAVALRVAGGLSLCLNFLRAFRSNPRDNTIYLFAPPNCGYEEFKCRHIKVHLIPLYLNRFWLRPYLDNYWLCKQIEAIKPDVVFSMGNMALPVCFKQLLLFHWSYAIYPESIVWSKMGTKDKLWRKIRLLNFKRGVRYATAVSVQTETAKKRLACLYGITENVYVVPNAVTLPVSQKYHFVNWDVGKRIRGEDRLLLCLTHYYSHKNLEVLIPLAKLIEKNGAPFKIITTIAADQHPKAKQFISNIKNLQLQDTLINIGPVSTEHIPSFYRAVHGMILPTLLESFSGTYVESMFFGVPIFTSDLDFAHDVCKGAAYYFNPMNPEDIFHTISTAYEDSPEMNCRITTGYEIVAKMPDWFSVADMYLNIMYNMVS